MWWVGCFENVEPPIYPWFFHHNYGLDLARCVRNLRRFGHHQELLPLTGTLPIGGSYIGLGLVRSTNSPVVIPPQDDMPMPHLNETAVPASQSPRFCDPAVTELDIADVVGSLSTQLLPLALSPPSLSDPSIQSRKNGDSENYTQSSSPSVAQDQVTSGGLGRTEDLPNLNDAATPVEQQTVDLVSKTRIHSSAIESSQDGARRRRIGECNRDETLDMALNVYPCYNNHRCVCNASQPHPQKYGMDGSIRMAEWQGGLDGYDFP